MLKGLRTRRGAQLGSGLLIGVAFGFLLQKGGVTRYDVILGQLLLEDFTVVKIMLSAVITSMIGVHLLAGFGLVELHPKPGSLGGTAIGGLTFGVGFGLLGYCPGTIAGAAGNGSLDALVGGMAGILIGAGLFSSLYPGLERTVLHKADFGDTTLPRLLNVNPWVLVVPIATGLALLLVVIESAGL
jgi:hypothetical protein